MTPSAVLSPAMSSSFSHAIGRSPVLADRLPKVLRHDVSVVVLGAALVGLFAQVNWHVKGWPVPFTGQTLAVLLVAAAAGSVRAALAMTLYGAAGIAGLPWLAGGAKGWPAFTFGYLVGFVAAAALVGWLAQRGWTSTGLRTIIAMGSGTLVIYAFGVPWLMHAMHSSLAAALSAGAVPFLVTDAIKVLMAAAVLPDATRWLGSRN